MVAESSRYLGVVERILSEPCLADLRPLYEAAHGSLTWQQAHSVQFPTRGWVAWWEPSPMPNEGSLWIFGIEEQRYDPTKRHERFRTKFPIAQAVEVLDLQDDADPDYARRCLTEDGLLLPFTPTSNVCLWINEGWIGPIPLELRDESGRWFLPQDRLEAALSVVRPVPEAISRIRIKDHERSILGPDIELTTRIGQVDWSSNEHLLRHVLRRLRNFDPGYTDQHGISRRSIDQLLASLGHPDLGELRLDEQALRRARDIAAGLAQRRELAAGVVSDLLSVPIISKRIEEERGNAERDARAAVASELEAQRQRVEGEIQDRVRQQEQRLEQLRSEEAELGSKVSDLRKQLESQLDVLDAELQARLNDISARPERLLAEMMVVRAALRQGQVGGSSDDTTNHPRGEMASTSDTKVRFPWCEQPREAIETIADRGLLRRRLTRALMARSLPTEIGPLLDSAFRAGALPLVAGPRAFDALEAYAACIAADRWLWVPVSVGTIDARELLGAVDTGRRAFVPAPSGLLDLLVEAQGTNRLYLVVLEGANRAAAEAYLSPLLACYADGWTSRRPRSLPLFHPCAVDPSSPYAAVPTLRWPRNVLLAGTLVDGVAAMPLPTSLWDHAVLIHLEQFEADAAVEGNAADLTPPVSEVSLDVWSSWRSEPSAEHEGTEMHAHFWSGLEQNGICMSPEVRSLAGRLLAAAEEYSRPSATTTEDLISLSLAPRAASARLSSQLVQALEAANLYTPRAQAAVRLAESVAA